MHTIYKAILPRLESWSAQHLKGLNHLSKRVVLRIRQTIHKWGNSRGSAQPEIFLVAQLAHGAIITSLLRQNDVTTSFRRHKDVIIASCARWEVLFLKALLRGLMFLMCHKNVTNVWTWSNVVLPTLLLIPLRSNIKIPWDQCWNMGLLLCENHVTKIYTVKSLIYDAPNPQT